MFKSLALGTGAVLAASLTVAVGTLSYQTTYGLSVDMTSALHHAFLCLVLGLCALGFLVLCLRGAVRTGVCFLLLAFAALSFGSVSAFAQDVATVDGSKLTINTGSAFMQYGQELMGWAVTALSGVISAAVAIYVPWAKSVATQQRIQMAGEALAEYAIKAVPNSVKDGKVTVDLGANVVATAVAHGMNVLPAKVIKAAKGGGGLAAVVFRVLDLEPGASKSNVLDPAVAQLQAKGVIK